MAQLWLPNNTPDFSDVLIGLAGAATGFLGILFIAHENRSSQP
jgi:hypothetical protein